MEVTGFHGTSRASSGSILANGFDLSRNEYDWLGEGVYFFRTLRCAHATGRANGSEGRPLW